MTQIVHTPQQFDYNTLRELVGKEIKQNPDSDGYLCSIRGLAKILGIQHSSLIDSSKQKNGLPQGILLKLTHWSADEVPDSLKPVLGFDYKIQPYNHTPTTSPKYLPEIVIQCVIEYYARDARQPLDRAKQLLTLFGTLGVRSLFAKVLGDEPVNATAAEQDIYLVTQTQETKLNPVQEALELISKLESYRLKREEIVAVLDNIGLLKLNEERNTTYRGVTRHKKSWRAQITLNGTTKPIGTYATQEEAARAYDAYAKVLYGAKAKLNF